MNLGGMGMGRAPSPAPTEITVQIVRPPGWTLDHSPEICSRRESEVPADLRWIRNDKIICSSATCICKLQGKGHTKLRAPASEVISHKVKDGVCFLLCTLQSPKTAPTYLRQCEVPKDVRMEYYNYLWKNGRPKPFENFWNDEKERAMRDAIFLELAAKEQTVQDEIAACTDTAEWAKKPKKGRVAPQNAPLATSTLTAVEDGDDEDGVTEGPEAEPESSGLWVVERVIGALLSHEEEKVRMWFLIKWDGWPQEENSWEPVAKKTRKKVQPADLAKCDGVNAQSPAVKDFYKTYGKPNKKRPKILSPEGEESELSRGADPKSVAELAEEAGEEKPKKRKMTKKNTATQNSRKKKTLMSKK